MFRDTTDTMFGQLKIIFCKWIILLKKYGRVERGKNILHRYFFFLQEMKTYYENMENFNADDNQVG